MTAGATIACAVLLAAGYAAAWYGLGRLDNQLGGAMLADPRPALRDRARTWLGLDRMENTMATVLDALRGLAEQQQAASAAQLTAFSNLQGAVQRLEQAVRDGQTSPEIEQAVADIREGFRVMQDAASRADDGYEPTEQPQEPTGPDGQPTQPGDVPATPDTTPPADDTARR